MILDIIIYQHQTADCPKCKKDTYISYRETFFTVVQCPHCDTKFKQGEIIK